MEHDVFLSYSTADKAAADAACAYLERSGIRCWVAPRDIVPGSDWGASIVEAIASARVFVLVFSSHTNASQQVRREVERAVDRGLAILPLRIEEARPEQALEYFLATQHWLDALSPPLERHLQALVDAVGVLLQGQAKRTISAPRERPRRRSRGARLLAALVLLAAIGASGATWLPGVLWPEPERSPQHAAAPAGPRVLRLGKAIDIPVGQVWEEELRIEMGPGNHKMTGALTAESESPAIDVHQRIRREVIEPREECRQELQVLADFLQEPRGEPQEGFALDLSCQGLEIAMQNRSGIWRKTPREPLPEGFQDWMLAAITPWNAANELFPVDPPRVGDAWTRDGSNLAFLGGVDWVDPTCRIDLTLQEILEREGEEFAVLSCYLSVHGELPPTPDREATSSMSLHGTMVVALATGLITEAEMKGTLTSTTRFLRGDIAGVQSESLHEMRTEYSQRRTR